MSNLEELIERLCPDGVEYKYLADVVTIKRGVRLIKKELKDNAKYPVYQNSLIPLGYYDDYNCEANKTMIITAGAAGDIVYSNTKFWAADDCFYFICNRYIDDKFLYYVLMSQQRGIYSKVRKASIPRLPRIVIEKIKLPVPPLEVQREIVRILDNFAIATTEIQQKLQEELAARQKQYEYYRDLLLTFKSNESTILNERTNELELSGAIRWMKLGDICDVRDGTHDSPKQTLNGKYLITSKNIKNGTIDYAGSYFISNEDFDKINLRSKVEINDILFTMIGTIGEIGLVKNEPDYAIKNVGLIKTNNELLSRFLKHYLKSKQVKKYIDNNKSQGSQSFLALGKLRNIPIPILKTQRIETIVDILDRFDALCNDITSGLPAEIEARQKQYEYYRDKLLTFKELKKEA
ncbi:restriction endonuclease subunit S [Phascolarctobacterium succinatutens]|uniref:restriction endonuclease subunit S n=2 Tax=Phascolarctobacterium succinatutens TaxID=626940 RepID=UPI003AF5CCA6